MNVFIIIAAAMAVILISLRRRQPVGLAMLGGSLVIWILSGMELEALSKSVYQVFTMNRTYELLFALYFVMCLENQLRVSGTLKGMLDALQHWFNSDRISIALMPAILGLLPSLGGAIFSAPMVQSLGNNLKIDEHQKSTINFWFRHVTEYFSPIQPGLILASTILAIPLGKMILHTYLAGVLALIVGWLVCIPQNIESKSNKAAGKTDFAKDFKEVFLTLAPVLFNFIFIVFLGGSAALSMAIVTFSMFVLLAMDGRKVPIIETMKAAFDRKLLLNVTCIVLFIQVLTNTQTLDRIVVIMTNSPLPIPVIIAAMSFLMGALTGMSQGQAAIVMPLVATIAPQDVGLAALAYVSGVAGQMVTPTHLCLVVTIDYFHADFFKTLNPVFLMQGLTNAIFTLFWVLV